MLFYSLSSLSVSACWFCLQKQDTRRQLFWLKNNSVTQIWGKKAFNNTLLCACFWHIIEFPLNIKNVVIVVPSELYVCVKECVWYDEWYSVLFCHVVSISLIREGWKVCETHRVKFTTLFTFCFGFSFPFFYCNCLQPVTMPKLAVQ